jgi:hypothetical protein
MRMLCCWLLALSMGLVAGCWTRKYPPVAFVDRLVAVYPDPRPSNCPLAVLTAPPTRPHKVFAQVRSYGVSAKSLKTMQGLMHEKACQEGADAIVLLPVEEQDHVTTLRMYPDWAVKDADMGYGGRFQRWVDKRYTVAQRGVAVVFLKETPTQSSKGDNRSQTNSTAGTIQ